MKKKIIIGVSAVAVLVVAFLIYETQVVAKKSPSKTTTYNAQGLDIKVVYCQPSKRGRLIFGEEKDGALQPFGKYWRLGANAATEITFSKDITFAGQPLKSGSYRMYAVPGADHFKVFLNSELGANFTAANEPDHANDVLQIDAPVTVQQSETEMFTINFKSDTLGIAMELVWDKTLFTVPIKVQ